MLRTRLYPAGSELPGEPRRQWDTEPSPDLALKTIWHEPTLDVLSQIQLGDAFA